GPTPPLASPHTLAGRSGDAEPRTAEQGQQGTVHALPTARGAHPALAQPPAASCRPDAGSCRRAATRPSAALPRVFRAKPPTCGISVIPRKRKKSSAGACSARRIAVRCYQTEASGRRTRRADSSTEPKVTGSSPVWCTPKTLAGVEDVTGEPEEEV